jgi:hypothetical protein
MQQPKFIMLLEPIVKAAAKERRSRGAAAAGPPARAGFWRSLGLPAMNTHHALSWTPSRPRWRPKMMPQREPPAYLRASVTAAITDFDPSSAAPTRSTAITKPNAAAVRAATSAWLCRAFIIVLIPLCRGGGPGVDEPPLQRGCVGKGFGSRNTHCSKSGLPPRRPVPARPIGAASAVIWIDWLAVSRQFHCLPLSRAAATLS